MGPDMFSADLHFTLSMILTFGCLLGFAVRELLLLRRGTWRPDGAEETMGPILPVDAVLPAGLGPLPLGLMPLTRGVRRRVRQRV